MRVCRSVRGATSVDRMLSGSRCRRRTTGTASTKRLYKAISWLSTWMARAPLRVKLPFALPELQSFQVCACRANILVRPSLRNWSAQRSNSSHVESCSISHLCSDAFSFKLLYLLTIMISAQDLSVQFEVFGRAGAGIAAWRLNAHSFELGKASKDDTLESDSELRSCCTNSNQLTPDTCLSGGATAHG